MIRMWVQTPMIGDGTDENPYQPDFSTIANDIAGWSLAGTDGTTGIAYVVTTGRYRLQILRQYIDVIDIDEITEDGRRERIPERTRNAVGDRFRALNVPEIDSMHVDVNPGLGGQ